MRNAALVLGIIAGIWGMIVGFFGYGYTEVIDRIGELPDLAEQVDHPGRIRAFALVAPVLALAGGAMARSAAQIGGILLLLSAAGMYFAFGYGVFTMFPIALAGLGGLLALFAVKPDPH
ncbi:hypothetical protein K3556_06100 [Aliiroseovarius sp. M344]|uniref:hypothetical protein n=1 Tax=Aliiroseovarius sp. M344 TaxID=2867010 RepID=UPI0021ADCE48|nr:hypothetical protein [Aliiroseovarius sp. M344]UWQ15456.1 hypothetical protein K3556_06100 [Aliiroseovarius sp. M344]